MLNGFYLYVKPKGDTNFKIYSKNNMIKKKTCHCIICILVCWQPNYQYICFNALLKGNNSRKRFIDQHVDKKCKLVDNTDPQQSFKLIFLDISKATAALTKGI